MLAAPRTPRTDAAPFQAEEAKLLLLSGAESAALGSWVSDARLREEHNGLVAWYCAGKAELADRLWLRRADGEEYADFFQRTRGADGALYARLWLHRALLDRMAARQHWAFADDTELTAAVVVGRLRSAVAYAAEVVPAHVLRTVKGQTRAPVADEVRGLQLLEPLLYGELTPRPDKTARYAVSGRVLL